MGRTLRPRRLTGMRIAVALAVAVVADGLQMLLGPVGWLFVDEIIDVVAMALTIWALGFHFLLLPTFIVEFIPVVDMLPTWTGCVGLVIALRKREERAAADRPIVDVTPVSKPPQIGNAPPTQGT